METIYLPQRGLCAKRMAKVMIFLLSPSSLILDCTAIAIFYLQASG